MSFLGMIPSAFHTMSPGITAHFWYNVRKEVYRRIGIARGIFNFFFLDKVWINKSNIPLREFTNFDGDEKIVG